MTQTSDEREIRAHAAIEKSIRENVRVYLPWRRDLQSDLRASCSASMVDDGDGAEHYWGIDGSDARADWGVTLTKKEAQ